MPHDPFLNQSQDRGGPQMPSLKAGQWLFNRRYELLRPLGAGGMGVVWLARDHTEEVEVALKFLPTILVLQEGEMRRLKEEVRAGKELRHPGIVATYGLEVEDSTAAIVMEYVPGKTLMERLEAQARGFFEPAEITGWLRGIAEAIDYLHTGAKRVHRDLKPANIIVDAAGEARLMDFGISSRIQEGVTRQSQSSPEPAKAGTTNNSSSTLAYASPQQITGKPAHPADDLYSLGATLYELLTGTPPFYRGGTEAVGLQIKTEPPTPIHERRAELVHEGANASTGENVPEAVEKAVLACLAKTREERPASASRVIQSFSSPSAPKRPSTPGSSEVSPAKSPPVPPRGLGGPLWRAFAALFLLAAAGWAWKALFPPDNRLDQLPHSQKDLDEAARKKVAEEMAEKTKKEAGRAAGPSAAASVPTTPNTTPAALGGPSALPASATKDAPFINSLGMKFVPVPISAGPSKGQRILFSIWETRSKDYAAFVKDSGHDAGEDWKTYSDQGVPVGRGENEKAEDSSHPVAYVSHDDAVAFCAWLTKKDRASGQIGPQDEYRLPSDVEWSYAVGIGDREDASASPKEKAGLVKEVYPWGNGYPPPASWGNFADITAKDRLTYFDFGTHLIDGYRDGYATTGPVGSLKCNSQGLFDVGGNVWEWTSSINDLKQSDYTLRGASWVYGGRSRLWSSSRLSFHPRYRGKDCGFRCVLMVLGAEITSAPAQPDTAHSSIISLSDFLRASNERKTQGCVIHIQRVHNFEQPLQEMREMDCFRISDPKNSTSEGQAFVSKQSSLGLELERRVPWQKLFSAEVSLEWRESKGGQKWIELSSVSQLVEH